MVDAQSIALPLLRPSMGAMKTLSSALLFGTQLLWA
jgi:hypothetical protein